MERKEGGGWKGFFCGKGKGNSGAPKFLKLLARGQIFGCNLVRLPNHQKTTYRVDVGYAVSLIVILF